MVKKVHSFCEDIVELGQLEKGEYSYQLVQV